MRPFGIALGMVLMWGVGYYTGYCHGPTDIASNAIIRHVDTVHCRTGTLVITELDSKGSVEASCAK